MEEDEILLRKINHSRKIELIRRILQIFLIIIIMTTALASNSLIIILVALAISIAIFAIPGLKKYDSSNSEDEIKEGEASSMKYYADLLLGS